jgi:hypothetical protein
MTSDDYPYWEREELARLDDLLEYLDAVAENAQWAALDDDDTLFDSGVDPYED